MNYEISVSKNALKAIEKGILSRQELSKLLRKFVLKMEGKKVRIDIKKLKGGWKGYYRIRAGKVRIVIKPNFVKKVIEVERIGSRGEVYK